VKRDEVKHDDVDELLNLVELLIAGLLEMSGGFYFTRAQERLEQIRRRRTMQKGAA
jgi:hypothetical protein